VSIRVSSKAVISEVLLVCRCDVYVVSVEQWNVVEIEGLTVEE